MELPILRTVLPLVSIFTVVAKHLSFTKAASELCLSQSAVSQSIRKLEAQLDVQLFYRFTRRISLTEEGERFSVVLEHSLGEIASELHSIKKKELAGTLTFTSPPSFGTNWLAPRINQFISKYQNISLNSKARDNLVDFENERIDIAIYYGDNNHPGLEVTHLMPEYLLPVCSKQYADEYDLWGKPENLVNCRLLHDSYPWVNSQYYSEWEVWVKAMGLEDVFNYKSGHTFDRAEQALVVACNHAGIAVGRKSLIDHWLVDEELVTPFKGNVKSNQAYYFVHLPGADTAPRIAAFKEWLLELVAEPIS